METTILLKMPEGGNNFESFSGAPQGAEKQQESQEKWQERQRKNSQAAAKQKQQEKRAKSQDDALAKLIATFLQNGNRSAHFLLIARLLSRNIPSDFILATIALIEPAVKNYIRDKLKALPAPKTTTKQKSIFPIEVKNAIDEWTNGIAVIAHTEPRRLIRTALDADNVPTSGLTQLFVLVLREHLEENHTEPVATKNLRAFGELYWQKLFSDLQKLTGEEHRLAAQNT